MVDRKTDGISGYTSTPAKRTTPPLAVSSKARDKLLSQIRGRDIEQMYLVCFDFEQEDPE